MLETRWRRLNQLRLRLVVAGVASLAAFGCRDADPQGTVLRADDFRSTEPAVAGGDGPGWSGAKPMATRELRRDEAHMNLSATPGNPADPSPTARPTDAPVMLDALVGQINGQPVYATEFLQSLDARLRANAEKIKIARDWQQESARIIYAKLMDRIRDDLLLAEARSTLTPEQRQGLFEFVNRLRDNLSSLYYGSAQLANEKLRESEGLGLQEKAQDELDRELIKMIVTKSVAPRVNVSWRDIEREYERKLEEFHPPPKALVRMIRVNPANAEGLDAVRARLDAGESFEAVASSEANEFSRPSGGLIEKTFKAPLSSAVIFGPKDLNERAQRLETGQTVGPFEQGGRVVWLHLERIDQPPPRLLEDAQLDIYFSLREKKFNDETSRFLNRLLKRGSFSDVQEMTEKLVGIATDRYLLGPR